MEKKLKLRLGEKTAGKKTANIRVGCKLLKLLKVDIVIETENGGFPLFVDVYHM